MEHRHRSTNHRAFEQDSAEFEYPRILKRRGERRRRWPEPAVVVNLPSERKMKAMSRFRDFSTLEVPSKEELVEQTILKLCQVVFDALADVIAQNDDSSEIEPDPCTDAPFRVGVL